MTSTAELGVGVTSVVVMCVESAVRLGMESGIEVDVVLDVQVGVTFTNTTTYLTQL